ncbi:MAG: RDD family protein [Tannerella sp.]|jgi:uncharacterized RDD family membrane protein YckC|nr:RDD family protein [Tannerella sp.]
MAESKIITSQFVEIEQTPTGVGERIFARIIDLIVIAVYVFGMSYFVIETNITYSLGNEWGIVVTFMLFLPAVFYSFLFETFNRGRSVGKMIFGLRVVMRDGTTPSLGANFMRWILLLLDFWCAQVGLFVMLVNRYNQRTGDIAAGTVVIKERDYHRINVSLDEFDHLRRNYHPFYPQAENLSLEQVNTINEALMRYDDRRRQRIKALSDKVSEFLKLSYTIDDETFLRTLLRDYQYYALEEI